METKPAGTENVTHLQRTRNKKTIFIVNLHPRKFSLIFTAHSCKIYIKYLMKIIEIDMVDVRSSNSETEVLNKKEPILMTTPPQLYFCRREPETK